MDGNPARAGWLAYVSLFGSIGTLVCCALPALLVLLGLGATVASILTTVPWLTTLSRSKTAVFAASGVLIAANFWYVYRIAPAAAVRSGVCAPDRANACTVTSRLTRIVLWTATGLYAVGFAVAFLLPLALKS
ncbi:MAG: hypothetical protein ACT4O1_11165 [Gemmatimonadota bacterium]